MMCSTARGRALRVLAIALSLLPLSSSAAAHANSGTSSTHAAAAAPPPAPCPPACAWDQHNKCCGVYAPSPDPEKPPTCSCPAALLFSAGQDNDMVLQRAPAKAAVYGRALEASAQVEVTVSGVGAPYTVRAAVVSAPGSTYAGPAGANYTAMWKAYLRPAPAGGSYNIVAKCVSGCGTGGDATREVAQIERVTYGDVFFCSGQSNMALPLVHTFSAKQLQGQMLAGKYSKLRFFQFGEMLCCETQGRGSDRQ